jgi:hypothetical protein
VAIAYAGKAGDGIATQRDKQKILRGHSRALLRAPLERFSIMLNRQR